MSISDAFGHFFQQLNYNLRLHFTPGLQSAFYTDRILVGRVVHLVWGLRSFYRLSLATLLISTFAHLCILAEIVINKENKNQLHYCSK